MKNDIYVISPEAMQATIEAQFGKPETWKPEDIDAITRLKNVVTNADERTVLPEAEDEQFTANQNVGKFLERLVREKNDLGTRLEALEEFLKNDDKHDFSDSKSFERLLEDGISSRQAEYLFDQRRQMRDLYRTLCLRVGDLIRVGDLVE